MKHDGGIAIPSRSGLRASIKYPDASPAILVQKFAIVHKLADWFLERAKGNTFPTGAGVTARQLEADRVEHVLFDLMHTILVGITKRTLLSREREMEMVAMLHILHCNPDRLPSLELVELRTTQRLDTHGIDTRGTEGDIRDVIKYGFRDLAEKILHWSPVPRPDSP